VNLPLSVSGGTAPYTWSAAGLSINSGTGAISGTPITATTSNVTVTATDSANKSGSASFNTTVDTCFGQKIVNLGFESGTASWAARLGGKGASHTDTLSQSVTIPAGCKASLTFYLHIDSNESGSTIWDKLTVTAGSTTLGTFSNTNAAAGYVLKTYDVSSFAGQTVTFKFTGVEDSSLQTSFVIDDTALTLS
jgi:hypothetical protein